MKWIAFLLFMAFFISRVVFCLLLTPKPWIKKPVLIDLTGTVVQIKAIHKSDKRFIFLSKKRRIYLYWYHSQKSLYPGEQWQFYCRLRPIHGLKNLVGFDYEKWLINQKVVATGYVIKGKRLKKEKERGVAGFRLRINQFIEAHIHNNAGLLMALTTGSRYRMTSVDWQILQKTGTSHLFAISGLHLGVIALLFASIVKLIWKGFPFLNLYFPAKKAAILFSSLFMVPYAFFVGWGVTVQRALLMILVFMFFMLLDRPTGFWEKFIFVALLVIAMQPESIYSMSFYLSFSAVYFIGLLSNGEIIAVSKWRQWFRLQMGLFFGLLSLNIGFFQMVSFFSPLANVVAIPWMTLLIVPCGLLASIAFLFSKTLSLWLFQLASLLLSGLWKYLQCFHL